MTVTAIAQAQSLILSGTATATSRDEQTTSPARGAAVPTPGLVRTIVPTIMGAILSFAAIHNIEVPAEWENGISFGLTGLLSGAYWLAVYKLQSRWPIAGLLLGSTARPAYTGRHRKTSADPTPATSDTPPEYQQ